MNKGYPATINDNPSSHWKVNGVFITFASGFPFDHPGCCIEQQWSPEYAAISGREG
jgi:hypothetical protein